ncbi:transmembrane protein 106A [Erpetoichthys calabaricus]|uniref:Transmembrane protein 106B n=1 Tax=Erpetoichthys calabaricus TaxID=27687 RepID=A0A8C4XGE0_ERPCA|nr:transmembrane protein 106A [Erpetoichthys calabaricus]
MGGSISSISLSKSSDSSDRKSIVDQQGNSTDTGEQSNGDEVEGDYTPYVEIIGRNSTNCPSCQGTGRIPRGQEKQLVALIPYSDQRLQPSRTKLYVFLSVLLCLLASALVMFFLYPRTITMEQSGMKSSLVYFSPKDSAVIMNVTNMVNITNNNFYSIHISNLNLQVLLLDTVVGRIKSDNETIIKPLGKMQLDYKVDIVINDPGMFHFCTMQAIKIHMVVFHIQGSMTANYVTRTEELPLETYQYIDCGANTTTPHIDFVFPS